MGNQSHKNAQRQIDDHRITQHGYVFNQWITQMVFNGKNKFVPRPKRIARRFQHTKNQFQCQDFAVQCSRITTPRRLFGGGGIGFHGQSTQRSKQKKSVSV